MELIIRDLGIESLKEHLKECRDYCSSLASQFHQSSSGAEQTKLAFAWDTAAKHTSMVQLLLELLERHAKEKLSGGDLVQARPRLHKRRVRRALQADQEIANVA